MLRRGWNEGQHLLLQTDDHAVKEGAHGAAQRPSLHGTAERRKKGLQAVQIHFRAAALLHRLLVTERLTGAAEEHITTGGLEFNHLVKLAEVAPSSQD